APPNMEHAAPDTRAASEPVAMQIESKPALHPEPVREPTSRRLAERIAGLASVPFAVPRCGEVELAADASGGLHLLALDRDDTNPTASLLAAQAWASVNREILAAACATALGAPVDPARPATLHLFTARPKRVRALLDADIRVHFLGEVEVNGKRAWCVAELN